MAISNKPAINWDAPPKTSPKAITGPIPHTFRLCSCKTKVVSAKPASPTTAGLPSLATAAVAGRLAAEEALWDGEGMEMVVFICVVVVGREWSGPSLGSSSCISFLREKKKGGGGSMGGKCSSVVAAQVLVRQVVRCCCFGLNVGDGGWGSGGNVMRAGCGQGMVNRY